VKPTGQEWRNWKKNMQRRGFHPENWETFWEENKGEYAQPQKKESFELGERLRLLELECKRLKALEVSHAVVRSEIVKITHKKPPVPAWMIEGDSPSKKSPGTPTLFASDWHWAEIIKAEQIGGVNTYDLETAHRRAKALIGNAVDLLKNHMVNPNYPGIVFVLGGDMFSGDIHEELSRTNETPIMPSLLDLFGVLIWCVETLADEFGAVFIPCVTGNHSRTTMKPFAKDRNHLSFDWLLYQLLDKHFQADQRVTFQISDGPDTLYKVYGHRYLLTHGDQFRGGDGMIGALGPIIRGNHKKQSRNAAINQPYDTLLLGHWHQYLPGRRMIVNGSLCGYNEYANQGNFGFEEPQQALWMTHPGRGITFHMPVMVEPVKQENVEPWVSVPSRQEVA
jgi:hypothetical protein